MQKVVLFETFSYTCQFFNSKTAGGYGCDHPKQQECIEEEGEEHGGCYCFSCPLGIEAEQQDLTDRRDPDAIKDRIDWDGFCEDGKVEEGEYLIVRADERATEEEKQALYLYEEYLNRYDKAWIDENKNVDDWWERRYGNMKKSDLKSIFQDAKEVGVRYIGIRIKNEGSSNPEILIIPKENFDTKLDYLSSCDDDLILVTGVEYGNSFDEIENKLMSGVSRWKQLISDAIDKSFYKMISETPPESEEEMLRCQTMKEAVKGIFLNSSRSAKEARFIQDNIKRYEEIFEICMNGDNVQFEKGLMELQRLQNEYILKEEDDVG